MLLGQPLISDRLNAGTRGAMDVIEIPSHFMENFMSHARTVKQFARHSSSGDIVPIGLVEQTVQDSQMFGALNMENQVHLPLWYTNRPPTLADVHKLKSDQRRHDAQACLERLDLCCTYLSLITMAKRTFMFSSLGPS